MSLNPIALFLNLIFSCVGLAYFIYGKKQAEFWFMGAGAGLMIFPYMFDGPLALMLVGSALCAAPFAARRWW